MTNRAEPRLRALLYIPFAAMISLSTQVGVADRKASMYRPEMQLRDEVVSACRESLARGAETRRSVKTRKDWMHWRERVRQAFRAPFPDAIFDRGRNLRARLVSTYDFGDYRVENVLFESLPGWEVNGSVYLPKDPGVYPGVVCPTGHSTKTGASYQRSAQVFARNGYIAISFDPPGCAGEIAHLNDHFTNGLIGYLTGFWSQSHFVVDAMACLDYLESRPDVDHDAGLSITGVSGGGITSFSTALLDDRVAFVAPVCCLAEHESIHLTGLYTSCPEQFGPGYIAAGLDYVDYIAALAPTPCLIMAGKRDEVFDYESTQRIAREAQRIYRVAGVPEACGLFIDDDSGHGYTVAMADEAVRWMDRIIRHTDAAPLPLTDASVPVVPAEQLLCHPSNEVNMFTVNRDVAQRLAETRPRLGLPDLREAAAKVLGLPPHVEPVRVVPTSDPRTSWHALVEELDIRPAKGVHVPAAMFSHVEDRSPRPALVWIDDQGKWAALRHGAFLCGPLRMFEPDCLPDQPRILSVDVSGLESLAPEPTAYDLAGWNDIERILTYLSIANARPVMGLRVRDALCALDYLRSRSDVDPDRLMMGGRGIGAVVALHAALLDGGVRRVVCLDMLSHYGSFTEVFPFAWSQTVMIPGILEHYDLPDVACSVEATTYVINPVNAQKQAPSAEQAESLFADAIQEGAMVQTGVDGGGETAAAVSAAW